MVMSCAFSVKPDLSRAVSQDARTGVNSSRPRCGLSSGRGIISTEPNGHGSGDCVVSGGLPGAAGKEWETTFVSGQVAGKRSRRWDNPAAAVMEMFFGNTGFRSGAPSGIGWSEVQIRRLRPESVKDGLFLLAGDLNQCPQYRTAPGPRSLRQQP